jgi:hypothetical protein
MALDLCNGGRRKHGGVVQLAPGRFPGKAPPQLNG